MFEDGAGRRSADPLGLAGPVPVVDLSALALLLAPPAMLGEFIPASPWRNVHRVPVALPQAQAADLRSAFTASVRELTEGTQTIGVLVSGGLDSLAVLLHVLRVADDRRVVALTTDLRDDAGSSAAAVVHELVDALRLPMDLVVLDPARDRAEPAWTAAGPRLDALPEVNAAAAETAHSLGCAMLLSGDGADELLGVPRFAAAEVARRRGVRGAVRYVSDMARSGPGAFGEVVALAAGLLPRQARARAYWAANWPSWCDPVASAVLAEPFREAATEWARRWVDGTVAAHASAGRTWAQADARDALLPREIIPPAGRVAEASPFLHAGFLAAALALPIGDRYHPGLPSAYQRCKAQVVRLLPSGTVHALPQRKQYFTAALGLQAETGRKAPICVEAGLIDPAALAIERDAAVLLVVAAIERWLAGALEHGADLR
ncbi:hypothetical protein Kpho02_70250 [Kitasatospora phosalacinea]|uniref:Asparagine synthetase domain-containing protein n=1 Tax=Kitasatospora phosalacinea TaxID=2065 RepID=A0A9W6QGW6_9ACTN|nr:asparagine synthase-related protein [Kitasatospora phosalacinea]GLW74728.1 hypothetical protein Kpho02_70250 [Kitasatospora phosalacinea]